jgi:class 3 adenylate cyclase
MDAEPASVARGFLFADLRNYSAWVESHGDHAAAVLLRDYRAMVRQAASELDGAEIKTEGDSFYIVFGSPSAAVRCGLRILELAAASQAAGGGPIPVGVGVHAGETVATDDGYVGSVVNVAARICAQAAAGELLVSDAVRSLTRTFLDVTFHPRGRRRLKGISEPIVLYRVMGAGQAAPLRRWRRVAGWRIVAAAAAAFVVVIAIALIGGALVRQMAGLPGPTPTPPPSQTAGEPSGSSAPSAGSDAQFPTAAETELLALLPESDRERCARADPTDSPVLGVFRFPGEPTEVVRAPSTASVECALGGISGPDTLWLWDLQAPVPVPNPDPAHIAIAAHAGLVSAPAGRCREQLPATETWSFGDMNGTLVCYENDTGDAVLLWVYDHDTRLFARAIRDDRNMAALLEWWEAVGRFVAP